MLVSITDNKALAVSYVGMILKWKTGRNVDIKQQKPRSHDELHCQNPSIIVLKKFKRTFIYNQNWIKLLCDKPWHQQQV